MRRPSFGSHRSATVTLLVVIVIAYVLQLTVLGSGFRYFALSAWGLRHGYAWQLLTYQLMHGSVPHLLLNCITIYFIGREVEEALGKRSFLTLYFSSGVVGGLLQALAGVWLEPFSAPVVGASAGAFGLVAGFALLYPERPLIMLFLPMRAKFLLLLSAIIAVIGILFPKDNIAHAAHLGGMITGIFYVRYAVHWNLQWPRFRRPRRQPLRRLVNVHSQKQGMWGRSKIETEDLPPEEFLSKEVDPILDKISAQGIQSLTERERKILETARTKMAKR